MAEFRAIRAGVLRRWALSRPVGADMVAELTRFNEAIDQALCSSVVRYAKRMEESRTFILGALAHDLRNPLSGIATGMHYLLRSPGVASTTAQVAARALRGTERMSALIHDLLDFSLARMGSGLPVRPEPADMGEICARVVEEMESSHPGRLVKQTHAGALRGAWDPARVSQLLVNLVTNALQHGDAQGTVQVGVDGTQADTVVLTVHNRGPELSEDARQRLFQPLNRAGAQTGGDMRSSGLGLGLYIASQIAIAHQGTLGVEPAAAATAGTTFKVRLPRWTATG